MQRLIKALDFCCNHAYTIVIGGVIVFAFLASLIAGIRSLAIGLSAETGAWEDDFDYMGKICTVINVFHKEEQERHENKQKWDRCYDKYTYSFTDTSLQLEGEVCMSAEEKLERSYGTCGGEKVPGSFDRGQKVDCWAPKVNPPPSFYRCHNPRCYKILHPSIDSKKNKLAKDLDIVMGVICLAMGAVIVLGVIFVVWCCFPDWKHFFISEDRFQKPRISKKSWAWQREEARLGRDKPARIGVQHSSDSPREGLIPCVSRVPKVGEKVTVFEERWEGKVTVLDEPFNLKPKEVATVLDVNVATRDGSIRQIRQPRDRAGIHFCLENPAGVRSDYLGRAGYYFVAS